MKMACACDPSVVLCVTDGLSLEMRNRASDLCWSHTMYLLGGAGVRVRACVRRADVRAGRGDAVRRQTGKGGVKWERLRLGYNGFKFQVKHAC